MSVVIDTYEYAGFEYQITKTADAYSAVALSGQHKNASHEKHCRAALECWQHEQAAKGITPHMQAQLDALSEREPDTISIPEAPAENWANARLINARKA